MWYDQTQKFCGCATVAVFLSIPGLARAQEAEEHDLHFTHPIFTESVSPDSKVRVDFAREWEEEGNANEIELEAEYGIHHDFSIEVEAPFVFLSPDVGSSESGLGNLEVAFKFANLTFVERGLLLGYGLAFGLPTGDEAGGIGSDHIWEIEPFFNFGVISGNWEIVGWTRFGIPTNQDVGEEVETEFHYDFSTLYHFSPRLQGLVELNGGTGLSGDEAGQGIVTLSPGIKVAPFSGNTDLFIGLGGGFPLGDEELNAHLRAAVFYHF
jgi:hypothetical protein